MIKTAEKLSNAAQSIDRVLDPIKVNNDNTRIGLKVLGLRSMVGGVYFAYKGFSVPESAQYPEADESVKLMGSVIAINGLAYTVASLRHSEDRIHFSDRRTPSKIYHTRAARKAKKALEDDQLKVTVAEIDSLINRSGTDKLDRVKAKVERRKPKHEAILAKHTAKIR